MNTEDKGLTTLTLDDKDYRAGKSTRECSCSKSDDKMLLTKPQYLAHLKDGTHNKRIKGYGAPAEAEPPLQ